MTQIEEIRTFWEGRPCGAGLSEENDRRRYFAEIETKRYRLESHIPQAARFDRSRAKDVLEIGCGIGTDGVQFARHGARYTGVDLTEAAIELAREQFALLGVSGRLEVANAESLPFPDESYDHVYSWGVIHHSPDTSAICDEIYRVLRPRGSFCVMVYNKSSVNYRVEIMGLRRVFRLLLRPRWMPALVARVTGFDKGKLARHRELLLRGAGSDKQEWLSMNTDGPDCPLAKAYGKDEVLELFNRFEEVETEVFFFNREHWPWIGGLLPERVGDWIGRRWGWHRVVRGVKPAER